MKSLLPAAFVLLGLIVSVHPGFAAESAAFSAVRRADAARIEAVIAADVPRLTTLLSDDLNYGHSDGRVQTKAQLITAIGTGRIRYLGFDYVDTHMTEIASGAVALHGIAELRAVADGVTVSARLRFLAIWRQEDDGRWRLFAYQSCALPPAESGAP